MTTVTPELDALDTAPSGTLTLTSGLEVDINRLRTREMLSLVRILTRGAGAALADLSLGADTTAEQFASQIVGIAIVSVPEAENETIEFVRRMVSPHGLIEARRLSKPEQEINTDLTERLAIEMENPELEDLFAVVERVIRNEAPHLQALGKKMAFLLQTATGQTNASANSSASN